MTPTDDAPTDLCFPGGAGSGGGDGFSEERGAGPSAGADGRSANVLLAVGLVATVWGLSLLLERVAPVGGWSIPATIALLIAGGAVLLYGVVPLMVRNAATFDATRPPALLSADEPLPPDGEAFLDAAERALAPHGFGRTAQLAIPLPAAAAAPGTAIRRVLLTNPPGAEPGDAGLEAGIMIAFVPPIGGWPGRRVMQTAREYADGSSLSVTNSPLDAPVRTAETHVLALDWLTEPDRAGDLWRAFEAADEAWRTAEPVHRPADDWADALDRGTRRTIGEQLLAGLRTGPPEVVADLRDAADRSEEFPEAPPGVYPATLRLAYLMTWRGLWPASAWLRRRERRRAVRRLREWGLHDLLP